MVDKKDFESNLNNMTAEDLLRLASTIIIIPIEKVATGNNSVLLREGDINHYVKNKKKIAKLDRYDNGDFLTGDIKIDKLTVFDVMTGLKNCI